MFMGAVAILPARSPLYSPEVIPSLTGDDTGLPFAALGKAASDTPCISPKGDRIDHVILMTPLKEYGVKTPCTSPKECRIDKSPSAEHGVKTPSPSANPEQDHTQSPTKDHHTSTNKEYVVTGTSPKELVTDHSLCETSEECTIKESPEGISAESEPPHPKKIKLDAVAACFNKDFGVVDRPPKECVGKDTREAEEEDEGSSADSQLKKVKLGGDLGSELCFNPETGSDRSCHCSPLNGTTSDQLHTRVTVMHANLTRVAVATAVGAHEGCLEAREIRSGSLKGKNGEKRADDTVEVAETGVGGAEEVHKPGGGVAEDVCKPGGGAENELKQEVCKPGEGAGGTEEVCELGEKGARAREACVEEQEPCLLFSPEFGGVGQNMLSTQMNRQINKVESFLKMDRLRRQKPMK